MSIWKTIESQAARKRRKIGIGILRDTEEMLEHLEIAKRYADITIAGKKIEGYKHLGSGDSEEENSKILIDTYKHGKIDGIVRGHIKWGPFFHYLKRTFKHDVAQEIALMKTRDGHEFFLGPGDQFEGHTNEEKLDLIEKAAPIMEEWKVKPKIGLLAADFTEDRGDHPIVDKSIDETEALLKTLKEKGYDAKNYAHLIPDAVKESNFVVPIDGILGNFIYRTLLYLGGATEYGSPVLIPENVIDNSRYNDRYSTQIIMAVARANRG